MIYKLLTRVIQHFRFPERRIIFPERPIIFPESPPNYFGLKFLGPPKVKGGGAATIVSVSSSFNVGMKLTVTWIILLLIAGLMV